MRKVILAVISSLSGLAGTGVLIFGIPGHIDDAVTWVGWLPKMEGVLAALFLLVAVVAGPLLWSSNWWWPLLTSWYKRHRSSESDRFRQLLPKIERCQKQLKPYAGMLSLVKIRLQGAHVNDDVNELVTSLHRVAVQLDELRIPRPALPESLTTVGVLSAQFQQWSDYLDGQRDAATRGDIESARHLWIPSPD